MRTFDDLIAQVLCRWNSEHPQTECVAAVICDVLEELTLPDLVQAALTEPSLWTTRAEPADDLPTPRSLLEHAMSRELEHRIEKWRLDRTIGLMPETVEQLLQTGSANIYGGAFRVGTELRVREVCCRLASWAFGGGRDDPYDPDYSFYYLADFLGEDNAERLDRLSKALKHAGTTWISAGEMPDEAIRLTVRLEGVPNDLGVRVLKLVARHDGSVFVNDEQTMIDPNSTGNV